jgi:hypothetical protein
LQNCIDVEIGNYDVLSPEQVNPINQEEEDYFQCLWKMLFDGACSKYGSGVGIVLKSPQHVINPHAIKMKFPCTNNEKEYE